MGEKGIYGKTRNNSRRRGLFYSYRVSHLSPWSDQWCCTTAADAIKWFYRTKPNGMLCFEKNGNWYFIYDFTRICILLLQRCLQIFLNSLYIYESFSILEFLQNQFKTFLLCNNNNNSVTTVIIDTIALKLWPKIR